MRGGFAVFCCCLARTFGRRHEEDSSRHGGVRGLFGESDRPAECDRQALHQPVVPQSAQAVGEGADRGADTTEYGSTRPRGRHVEPDLPRAGLDDGTHLEHSRADRSLAARQGAPRAVLSDGAAELRDAAEVLRKSRPDTIVLGDFQHRAANVLKSTVGGDTRFAAFPTPVGRTRPAIPQTELAHLVPPAVRPQARFLNLATTRHGATTMLWLLDTPHAQGRESITAERLEDQPGWLRAFRDEVARWTACQRVVSTGVTFVHEQGLSRSTADRFHELVAHSSAPAARRDISERLTTFLRAAESRLTDGERLPLSTEILESSFGLYKQLERQHSKSGFTSLIATFGSLLRPATPTTIRAAFDRVKVKDIHQWLQTNLPKTFTAKRLATYKEFQSAHTSATKITATT